MNKRIFWWALAGVLTIAIGVGVGAYCFYVARPSTTEIASHVASMLQKKIDGSPLKDLGLHVGKVVVIHDQGSRYQGIATVTMDGEDHDVAVKILVDDERIMTETDPSEFAFAAQAAFRKEMSEHPISQPPQEPPQRHDEQALIALDPFTVNLKSEGGEKFLQVGFTLQVPDALHEQLIKDTMRTQHSRILLLLSSKTASDVSTPEGKKKLSDEIIASVNEPVTPEAPSPSVTALYYNSFVIQ